MTVPHVIPPPSGSASWVEVSAVVPRSSSRSARTASSREGSSRRRRPPRRTGSAPPVVTTTSGAAHAQVLARGDRPRPDDDVLLADRQLVVLDVEPQVLELSSPETMATSTRWRASQPPGIVASTRIDERGARPRGRRSPGPRRSGPRDGLGEADCAAAGPAETRHGRSRSGHEQTRSERASTGSRAHLRPRAAGVQRDGRHPEVVRGVTAREPRRGRTVREGSRRRCGDAERRDGPVPDRRSRS